MTEVELSVAADLLRDLARDVERLGETLCRDAHMSAHHPGVLQEFDRIAQMQRELASLLSVTTENAPLTTCLESIGARFDSGTVTLF